ARSAAAAAPLAASAFALLGKALRRDRPKRLARPRAPRGRRERPRGFSSRAFCHGGWEKSNSLGGSAVELAQEDRLVALEKRAALLLVGDLDPEDEAGVGHGVLLAVDRRDGLERGLER